MSRTDVCVILAPLLFNVVVLLLGCVTSCQGQSPSSARATWILLATQFEEDVSPTPDPEPEPDSDICENCDGKGKLGDGTIERICPVCDGTGKKKRSVVYQSNIPTSRNHIKIYSADWCEPCKRLEAEVVPVLIQAGWKIERINVISGEVPRTEVWIGGRQRVIRGYEGRNQYLRKLKEEIEQLRKGANVSQPNPGRSVVDRPVERYQSSIAPRSAFRARPSICIGST